MRNTQTIINELPDFEINEIINDFEKFERDGFIGDCKLRSIAESLPGGREHITLFMNMLAMECYRFFADKHRAKFLQ